MHTKAGTRIVVAVSATDRRFEVANSANPEGFAEHLGSSRHVHRVVQTRSGVVVGHVKFGGDGDAIRIWVEQQHDEFAATTS